jgi:hypothetical protein
MAILTTIVPSDTTTHAPGIVWLYVGAEGDIAVLAESDSVPVTLRSVPAGTTLRFAYPVAKVMATNTTASDMAGGVGGVV